MRCSNCQANIPDHAQFCAYCGQKIKPSAPPPTSTPPPLPTQPVKQPTSAQPQPVKQTTSCAGCFGMSVIAGLLLVIALFLLLNTQQTTIMAIIQLIEESISELPVPLSNELPVEAKQAIEDIFNRVPSYETPKPYQIIASQRATKMESVMDELWCVVVEVYPPERNSYHGALLVYREGAYWAVGSAGMGLLAPRIFQDLSKLQRFGCTIANGYDLRTSEGLP